MTSPLQVLAQTLSQNGGAGPRLAKRERQNFNASLEAVHGLMTNIANSIATIKDMGTTAMIVLRVGANTLATFVTFKNTLVDGLA
jgi:hypothetical protein